MPRTIHVFDLDDTLINGDCSMLWHEYLVAKGIVTDPHFLQQDRHMMSLYAFGNMSMEDYLLFSLQPLAALSVSTVDALVEDCVHSDILPRVFPQAKLLLAKLASEEADILVISASAAFLVQAVTRKMGIPQAIGIDLKQVDGCYSHQIEGVPSYRGGKVTRLKSWLAEQGCHDAIIHFYTDSMNDLPLCLYADQTYVVNPCEKLAVHARDAQWPTLHWG